MLTHWFAVTLWECVIWKTKPFGRKYCREKCAGVKCVEQGLYVTNALMCAISCGFSACKMWQIEMSKTVFCIAGCHLWRACWRRFLWKNRMKCNMWVYKMALPRCLFHASIVILSLRVFLFCGFLLEFFVWQNAMVKSFSVDTLCDWWCVACWWNRGLRHTAASDMSANSVSMTVTNVTFWRLARFSL